MEKHPSRGHQLILEIKTDMHTVYFLMNYLDPLVLVQAVCFACRAAADHKRQYNMIGTHINICFIGKDSTETELPAAKRFALGATNGFKPTSSISMKEMLMIDLNIWLINTGKGSR